MSQSWEESFSELFQASAAKYQKGHQKTSGLVDAKGQEFLRSIGYTEQEFFDFVEDFSKDGEPTLATALAIASVRRAYFLQEQKGKPSTHIIPMKSLPPKDAEVEGIGWLPRIIVKAQAKLRGEMPPELMYGCGGDRKFFRANGINPVEFLRQTWEAKGDSPKMVTWVKKQKPLSSFRDNL